MITLRSYSYYFVLFLALMLSPSSVEAINYSLSATFSITCPAGATPYGKRSNTTTGTQIGGISGTYTTPTSVNNYTFSQSAAVLTMTEPFVYEVGYTSGGVITKRKFFKSTADVSTPLTGDPQTVGTYNPSGTPQVESTGVEVNVADSWTPYEVTGYTLGDPTGATTGSNGYTNNTSTEQTLQVTVKDGMGNIVDSWPEYIPAGGSTSWNMNFESSGYTLEYGVTGSTVIDGALRDYTIAPVTVTASNPITSQTQTATTIAPVINHNTTIIPTAISTETRTLTPTAALTNASEDQRSRELRAEIMRLGTIADNIGNVAHTDALAIKTAIEGIEVGGGGGTADLTATNTKLDTIHSDLTGASTSADDAALPAEVGTTATAATSLQTGLFTNLETLKTALVNFGNRVIPTVSGSALPTPSFVFNGNTHTFDFSPHSDLIAAFRLLLLGSMLLWFTFAVLQELHI